MLDRTDGTPRYVHGIRHGDTIYLSGQVPDDMTADAGGQIRQVLSRIDQLLAFFSTDKSQLLSATIYLRDISALPVLNEVWQEWIARGRFPTRTVVEARMSDPDCCVEVTAIAAA